LVARGFAAFHLRDFTRLAWLALRVVMSVRVHGSLGLCGFRGGLRGVGAGGQSHQGGKSQRVGKQPFFHVECSTSLLKRNRENENALFLPGQRAWDGNCLPGVESETGACFQTPAGRFVKAARAASTLVFVLGAALARLQARV
jgi:hypothetical protein